MTSQIDVMTSFNYILAYFIFDESWKNLKFRQLTLLGILKQIDRGDNLATSATKNWVN